MIKSRITAAVAGAILTAAVVLSGCSAKDGSGSTSGSAAQPRSDQDGGEKDAGVPGPSTADARKAAPGAEQPSMVRAIIKTGSLTIEVTDVDAKRQEAIGIVTALRGQVASEDTGSQSDGRINRADLTLKVPATSYETAIRRLSGIGKRTRIQQESSDVTEQVVDVESRISSQRAALARMRVLLDKATTIGEIVSVETELTRREADLESLLAKQKTLAGQTELATLRLTVVEPGKAPASQDDRGFLSGLSNGWGAFTSTVSLLATLLGALLPFVIAFALVGVPLWRLRRRLRRTPTAAPAGPPLPAGPDPS